MTKTEFEAGTWDMRCLLLEALTRRLKEDSAGESRMAAAELSSCVNFLKQMPPMRRTHLSITCSRRMTTNDAAPV